MLNRPPKTFQEPTPEDYVPGRGRGATGFVTNPEYSLRANAAFAAVPDAGAKFGTPPPGYVAGRGRGLGDTRRETLAKQAAAARSFLSQQKEYDDEPVEDEEDVDDGRPLDDEEQGLFANTVYDEDDREADEIYDAVEKRMESRRQRQREERINEELKKYRNENPSLEQQFADLKRGLAQVSEEEWASIPEIGDYRVKKQKLEKYTPVPDSVIESAHKERSFDPSIGTLSSTQGVSTDLASIGEGRGAVLGLKLDRISDSVSGQTVVDPKGYLTELAGMRITSESEIGDIKKARMLLKSVTSTNPKHAPGWIAAARLEEIAGRISDARALITEGCQKCPTSEDVWLEAARLYPQEQAKQVLASAVQRGRVPGSIKIWLQAAAIESDITQKKRILRKALEIIPTSAKLWSAAIELEPPEGARILLSRAVECVPHATELWIALSRLESYENAKVVLNKAREAIPAEPLIWITAAKLEEAHEKEQKQSADNNTSEEYLLNIYLEEMKNDGVRTNVTRIIERAVRTLSMKQQIVDRDRWLKEAKESESGGYYQTARDIIHFSSNLGIEEVDRERIWLSDAETAEKEGYFMCARALFALLVSNFPGRDNLWLRAAHFEKEHGTFMVVDELLRRAVAYCPRAEQLWLLAANEKWRNRDADGARAVLHEAFSSNPGSETIWLEAVALEKQAGELDRARILASRARNSEADSGRVYYKSALLEREAGCAQAERELLEQGISKHPDEPKLWLMLGQWHERQEPPQLEEARNAYTSGLQHCPHCVPLWVSLAHLEERANKWTRARAVLERARQKLPKEDILWEESIWLEERIAKSQRPLHSDQTSTSSMIGKTTASKSALSVLAKALQECPDSGRLWAVAIELESAKQRRARSVDALTRCDRDPHVMIAVARLFWGEHKIEKARSWFRRAVALDSSLGDAWAAWYAFEKQENGESEIKEIETQVESHPPKRGTKWCKVRKDVESVQLTTLQVLEKVAQEFGPLKSF
ncbi:hypothetical protein GAYE_SCF65G6806 [Galdieria yellowstonensis]|uniref:PRP1 splicing factor N-terminal domain-containing protein n=1 Tax=Galdieria yellowstonensis TaxID=3028027 RepID=A0AAV9INC4_9RHOD|nr:hypothetical protein GAYE_SCF65G6806 [Galdieria yellowstonensis]